MAIVKPHPTRFVLDLRGPDGNAFMVIGYARKIAKAMGQDPEAASETLLKCGSYEELLRIFCKRYSDVIDVILPETTVEEDITLPMRPVDF